VFFKEKKFVPIRLSLVKANDGKVNLDLHLLHSKLQKNSGLTQQSSKVTDVTFEQLVKEGL
jgi:hypothetical protein